MYYHEDLKRLLDESKIEENTHHISIELFETLYDYIKDAEFDSTYQPDEINRVKYTDFLDVFFDDVFSVNGKEYYRCVDEYTNNMFLLIEKNFNETVYVYEGEIYTGYEEAENNKLKGEYNENN